MNAQTVIDITRQALMTTFWVSLPLLAIGLITGVAISLIQILTSMQEPSVGAVPRLIAFLVGIVLLLPWMLNRLLAYSAGIFGDLGRYAR